MVCRKKIDVWPIGTGKTACKSYIANCIFVFALSLSTACSVCISFFFADAYEKILQAWSFRLLLRFFYASHRSHIRVSDYCLLLSLFHWQNLVHSCLESLTQLTLVELFSWREGATVDISTTQLRYGGQETEYSTFCIKIQLVKKQQLLFYNILWVELKRVYNNFS